jgi:xanthine dehydrogenase accessory factor
MRKGIFMTDIHDIRTTRALYAALTDRLHAGYAAAVKTDYGQGTVRKLLFSEDESDDWNALQAELYGAGTPYRHDGPVSRLEGADALTIVERYTPKPRLIVLGGGHIALDLVRIAKLIDFSVTVFDDRPMFANPGRFPGAAEVICDDFSHMSERLRIRSSDYVVIVTRGHKHDTECLEGILKGTPPAYTGMIGSKRRVAIVMRQLAERDYPQNRLDEVHTPIGLMIGAVTPAEIAVSIMAEIIDVKRRGRGTVAGLTCETDIAEWLAAHGEEADALITIVTSTGSVPRETGAKMAVNYQGNTSGTIGGGCAEGDVIHRARTVIREGGYEINVVDMTDTAEDDGMVCGGKLTVVIEKAVK